ncbi:hypothetical protein CVT25_012615 [Psilocybe cyanescens]|uniref:Uncharacterized protein n=1 Tax=Psilocybe cyanescens TaxID=93625 RepID=A0A409W1J6_PSICY|nr:hypothetical protein CVT25_012615 [Psilocybe cyanescens]
MASSSSNSRTSDHPIKILPYPTSVEIPTYCDAIQDLLRLDPEEQLKGVQLWTGTFSPHLLTGRKMVDVLVKYLETRSTEDYKRVVFPLQVPVPRGENPENLSGIGRIDLNSLIPDAFRQPNRVLRIGGENWSTALVPPGAVTMMHSDHFICGQIMPHFFGRKLWFLCPATSANMTMWYKAKGTVEQRMLRMISECDDLFVWLSEKLSIMVVPPHCFHSVLTFTLGCHSGVRVGSDYWIEDMVDTLSVLTDQDYMKEVRKDRFLLEELMGKIMPDMVLWVEWCEEFEREPTERELEIMSTMKPALKTINRIEDIWVMRKRFGNCGSRSAETMSGDDVVVHPDVATANGHRHRHCNRTPTLSLPTDIVTADRHCTRRPTLSPPTDIVTTDRHCDRRPTLRPPTDIATAVRHCDRHPTLRPPSDIAPAVRHCDRHPHRPTLRPPSDIVTAVRHCDRHPTLRLPSDIATAIRRCDRHPTLRPPSDIATAIRHCDRRPTLQPPSDTATAVRHCDRRPTLSPLSLLDSGDDVGSSINDIVQDRLAVYASQMEKRDKNEKKERKERAKEKRARMEAGRKGGNLGSGEGSNTAEAEGQVETESSQTREREEKEEQEQEHERKEKEEQEAREEKEKEEEEKERARKEQEAKEKEEKERQGKQKEGGESQAKAAEEEQRGGERDSGFGDDDNVQEVRAYMESRKAGKRKRTVYTDEEDEGMGEEDDSEGRKKRLVKENKKRLGSDEEEEEEEGGEGKERMGGRPSKKAKAGGRGEASMRTDLETCDRCSRNDETAALCRTKVGAGACTTCQGMKKVCLRNGEGQRRKMKRTTSGTKEKSGGGLSMATGASASSEGKRSQRGTEDMQSWEKNRDSVRASVYVERGRTSEVDKVMEPVLSSMRDLGTFVKSVVKENEKLASRVQVLEIYQANEQRRTEERFAYILRKLEIQEKKKSEEEGEGEEED